MTPQRHRLPVCRQSLTRKNSVGSLEFYVTVSFYDDEPNLPGEIFVNIAKEGSTLAGLVTSIALVISLALQHRSPWPEISKHLRGARFDPAGVGVDGVTTYQSLSEAIAVTVDKILEARAEQLTMCLKDSMVESSNTQLNLKLINSVTYCKDCGALAFQNGKCAYCLVTSPLSPTTALEKMIQDIDRESSELRAKALQQVGGTPITLGESPLVTYAKLRALQAELTSPPSPTPSQSPSAPQPDPRDLSLAAGGSRSASSESPLGFDSAGYPHGRQP